MSSKQFVFSLLILIIFAGSLIFYRLGQVPHGMTWDEVSIAYNGYAVITTRRDEWLTRLPLSFRAFGDYKTPLPIYLNGFFTVLLGMEVWVMRLPFALAGVASVAGFTLLGYQWLKRFLVLSAARSWAVAGGVGLVTLPWFLHHVRVGWESGLALGFLIWGQVMVTELVTSVPLNFKFKSQFIRKVVVLLMGAGLLSASIYSYLPARIVTPVVTGLVIWYLTRRQIFRWWREIGGLLLTTSALLGPLVWDSIYGQGAERFNQATVLSKGLGFTELLTTLLQHSLTYFDPRFLIGGWTVSLRHGDGQWGIMLPTLGAVWAVSLGLLLVASLRQRLRPSKQSTDQLSLIAVGFLWFIVGLLPGVVGIDGPHSNRILLAIPGALMMVVGAAQWLFNWVATLRLNHSIKGTHDETFLVIKSAVGMFILIHGLLFISYLHHYYTVFAPASAADYMDGYVEAFRYVVPFENGSQGRPEKAKILFTSDYGHPYIYALFVRQTNPIMYQGGSLIKYEFTDKITMSDLDRENTVIVASGEDNLPVEKADHLVYGSDGQIRFKIYVK